LRGQLLLLGKQLSPGSQPLVPCGDLGKTHRALLTLAGGSACSAYTRIGPDGVAKVIGA
jgi:hypothetical protein